VARGDASHDIDHKGLGFGDRLNAVGPLLDEAQSKRVGRYFMDCFIARHVINLGAPYVCSYVLKLRRAGTITTEGVDPHGPSDVLFAVTGGTDDYAGATGEAEHVDTSVTDVIIHLG